MLADAGFDLVHELDTAICASDPELAVLADPARRRGLLVGNTRALWPKFREVAHTLGGNPLDTYTERVLAREFPGARVWLGHRRYDGAFVPLQRIAEASGLATFAPTGLAIHPIYGPWFALRAVVALEGAPVVRAPIAPVCRCERACLDALAAARAGSDWRAWLAVRDACPIGREHRYSDEQIRYHYTKDLSSL